MRIVYVFDDRDPEGEPYLVRAPRALAWLLCRVMRHLDYALFWPEAEEMEAAAAAFMATPDTLI